METLENILSVLVLFAQLIFALIYIIVPIIGIFYWLEYKYTKIKSCTSLSIPTKHSLLLYFISIFSWLLFNIVLLLCIIHIINTYQVNS